MRSSTIRALPGVVGQDWRVASLIVRREGSMATTPSRIEFPCRRVPQDATTARLLGLYPQRQEGLWMQRVKVLGGLLTSRQWRALGEIALEFTPEAPLHLTTRQDLELHDLTADQVPAVQRRLADACLTSVGACGDTLRNITVCPCSGAFAGAVDLFPLAWEVRRALEAEEGTFSLPRKFKISFSCCRGCGQPWINDLGFVVRRRKGRHGFHVIGAGSLGARPATGIVLFDCLAAAHVQPLVVAAVRVFAAEGDREHRSRARLRHVRERIGDKAFVTLLREALEAVKAERDWPEVDLPGVGTGFPVRTPLTFANGNLTPAAANALAELADQENIRLRIANHHQVMVFGRDDQQLGQAIRAFDPLAEAAKPQPAVVACPGTRWCKRALADTHSLAERIRKHLGDKISPDVQICVSGCPNDCGHSRVADIGLVGAVTGSGKARTGGYNVYVGGGMGRNDELAVPVALGLPADQALARVAQLAGAMHA